MKLTDLLKSELKGQANLGMQIRSLNLKKAEMMMKKLWSVRACLMMMKRLLNPGML